MTFKIADHILSPLGQNTDENYAAVLNYQSGVRGCGGLSVVLPKISASLFSEEQKSSLRIDGLSRFESMVVRSVSEAVSQCGADLSKAKVVFILSTTKGNIEQLTVADPFERYYPGISAQHILDVLGLQASPIVVCNACISGLSALILASRLLDIAAYDYAIVCGADCQSPFIISGFQSLQALSADACRPFDIERTGLNLGEAAATMILSRRPSKPDDWGIAAGCIRNDAYHISAPSKKGDGALLALQSVLHDTDPSALAVVNAHGTATMFNDQMESVAIERAGLNETPVNAYKGYFGHTLGAAGVLETILSMAAADDHTILGTRGFEERGVSGKIKLSNQNAATNGQQFIKMISGFGGCNGAILGVKSGEVNSERVNSERVNSERVNSERVNSERVNSEKLMTHTVEITPKAVTVDGKQMACEGEGKALLTDLYKRYIDNYPKFYKMDPLCRLGFVASELLLQAEGDRRDTPRDDRAIILFNRSSSIQADEAYQASIQDAEDYFPSPAAFVYTLPNIVTGEIAIRNHYQGETSFYILPERNDQLMQQILDASLGDKTTKSILGGWIDYEDDENFVAKVFVK
jgi:3-oxoacyl-[acyl-carrier-protein] synthase-1